MVRDGKVLRNYRNQIRFPYITALSGKAVPERLLFYRKGLQIGVPSDIDTRLPESWIDVERGRQAPTMSEQVYLQSNGFTLIMLWHEPADDPDYDEDGDLPILPARWSVSSSLSAPVRPTCRYADHGVYSDR